MAEFTDEMAAKLEKVDELEAKVQEQAQKIEGQETLIQRWKTEIGDARREFKAAQESGSAQQVKDALDRLKKLEDNVGDAGDRSGSQSSQGKEPPKTLADMQAKLKESGKLKAADKVWSKLPKPEREAIATDSTRLAKFFEAASGAPDEVPDSLLDGDDTSGDAVNPYSKLFDRASSRAMSVPGATARLSGDFAGTGEDGKPIGSRRLHDGVLPRPPSRQGG